MEIKKITKFCNCYLIKDEETVLIDAGADVKDNVDTIILTHCHYDHIAYLHDIVHRTGARVYAGVKDSKDIQEITKKTEYDKAHINLLPVKIDKKLKNNDVLEFSDFKLKVITTPGHTTGSICLYNEETQELFSGDTVFDKAMNITGRTDFLSGNKTSMINSLKKLKKLKIKKIYPGHDY
jgi:glyoxylase-like metal-dependent hydrolase (beta-lactamase superfamily II)